MAKNDQKFGPKNLSFWRIFGTFGSFGVVWGILDRYGVVWSILERPGEG